MVNTSEHTGGAAIAANRLMDALNKNGVKAEMLVRDKTSDNPAVAALPKSPVLRWNFVAERLQVFAACGFKKKHVFEFDNATFGTDITKTPQFKAADIIHLHWINQGFLSLNDIGKILKSGKPVVWTLHDMWPFTGICHHSGECRLWESQCHDCPKLPCKPRFKDMAFRTFKKKLNIYSQGKISFVACSDWLANLARASVLTNGNVVESIPNAIDTNFFSVGDKVEARKRLGLPQDKKLILFVAYKATDKFKGIDYLQEAVAKACQERKEFREDVAVVPVGRESETLENSFETKAYPQRYVTSESVMRDLYRAADVLAMPTLQDNLPNTIAEAMACGKPCVGFEIGGLPQMIDSGKNGYLSRDLVSSDFAKGLVDTLYSPNYGEMCENARAKADQSYSESSVSERYISLYNRISSAEDA